MAAQAMDTSMTGEQFQQQQQQQDAYNASMAQQQQYQGMQTTALNTNQGGYAYSSGQQTAYSAAGTNVGQRYTTYQQGVPYASTTYNTSQTTSYGAPQVTTTYGPTQTTHQSTVTQNYVPVGQSYQSTIGTGTLGTSSVASGGVVGVTRPAIGAATVTTGATTTGATISGGSKIENTYYGASRFVTGEERVVGYNTIQQEERVISERVVTHEVKVPKKIVREEVIEKVIIVPETVTREEVIEEVQTVRETIVEVAKPIIQEKIVEVPEIEYRDKIVEVVEKMVQTKVKEVPRIEYQERVVEVPKIIMQEKVVEVPEVEYREIVTEKVVEVPEIREQVVVKEIQGAPRYVDKPVAEYVNIEVPVDIHCNLPVPVEAITTFEYQLAQFRPRVNKVTYPLYVPRFVEVPVAAEMFSAQTVSEMKASAARLATLNMAQAVGLCEVENLATEFRGRDLTSMQITTDLRTALMNHIKSGAHAGVVNMGTGTTGVTTLPATTTGVHSVAALPAVVSSNVQGVNSLPAHISGTQSVTTLPGTVSGTHHVATGPIRYL